MPNRVMRFQRPLILLIIAALLPLVILSAVLGAAWLRQQQASLQREALDRVERTAALLDRELDSQVEVLRLLARSPLLDGALNAQPFAELVERFRGELPLWHTVVLSDLEGNRLIDAPEPVGGRPGRVVDIESHAELVRTGKPVLGGILRGPRNRPAFAIRVPVTREGQLRYVLSAVIQPDSIAKLLRESGIPNGWIGAVVDADGRLVARTAGPPELIGGPASASVREALQTASGGLYEGKTIEGLATFTAFRVLPDYGWSVHIGLPRDAYLAPLKRSAWVLAGAGLAALGLVGAFLWLLWRELDARRRAEGAIAETRRLEALGRMTGGVAHDFNNLLMIMQGSAEAIRRRLGNPEKVVSYADAIIAAARRGETLTRQLLAFSGRGSGEPIAFRLQDREADLLTLLRQSARGDIALDLSIPPSIWPIHADPNALEIALINLAVNARDAMPEGGGISVKAANRSLRPGANEGTGLTGDFVAITVSDTGTGIDPQHLGRIFEPFFTTKPSGTGLGLSQVYGFAKQSGGAVTVASGREGTVFTLYLPRAAKEPAAAPPQPAPQAEPRRMEQAGSEALLVEDNAEVARVVEAMLSSAGYAVTLATNGTAALALLKDGRRFGLVLSDIVMEGGLSGLELGAEIRKRHPDLPVILMTGYSEVLLKSSSHGLPVLPKPFRYAELETALAELRVRHPQQAVAGAGKR